MGRRTTHNALKGETCAYSMRKLPCILRDQAAVIAALRRITNEQVMIEALAAALPLMEVEAAQRRVGRKKAGVSQ